MKRGIFFMLSLCMLMLCGMSSCRDDSATKEELLVGKWKSTKVDYLEYENGKLVYEESQKCISWYLAMDFRDNGTGTIVENEDGGAEVYVEEIKSWTIMGEDLIITFDSGEVDEPSEIIELNNKSMILKFVDEETYNNIKLRYEAIYYFTKI
ncbi:MAG: lipocalin family protein [Bacteroidales bacterium]|nr:lipocalin family protein [Bacteroidales bacterium]